jgi:hypothetical protein
MSKVLAKAAYLNSELNILFVHLTNGILVSEDLNKYPDFIKAKKKHKRKFEVTAPGDVIYWDKLDVHLSVAQIAKDFFKSNKLDMKQAIKFEDFLTENYGKPGTAKRKKADTRLNKIAKDQEQKISKTLKK